MTATGHLPNLAATLGGWSARHRLTAVGAWLALVIVTMLVGGMVGQVTMNQAEYGVGESGRATWTLVNAGIKDPASELVMISSSAASPDKAALRSAATAVLAAVKATGQVSGVRPPAFSASGQQELLQFSMKGDPDTAYNRVQPVEDAVARVAAAHRNVTIEEVGQASVSKWFNDTIFRDFRQAEWTVIPLALGILLVIFGALLAALLPVVLALTAFLAANGILALVSHVLHVDSSASSVMMLMGMAVGVDYCLFYLRREREERAKGASREAALRTAAATSGRSVLISGLTVMVAMAGMFLAGVQIFDGFAIATISVVLIAVVGSVTVLPALLSLLGDKVELGRIPFLRRIGRSGGGRFWTAALDRVLAHPGRSAVLATGLLLALAAPALSIRTEFLNVQQMLPSNSPIVQRYDHIMTAFPGGPNPAVVVVKAPDIRSAVAQRQIAALTSYHNSALGQPVHTIVYPKANLAEISIPLAGTGNDATSRQALTALHDTIVPATVGQIPGGTALVGGDLAARIDWNNQMGSSIVPVILFVMGITFLLMLVSFGSLTIAATSMALNLLSVGAAYGALSAVFVHGWGAGLVGTQAPGAIESWIPLFVFVVLFGLSMDYNVFVVSRIREGHDRGLPTREAVAYGIRSTAGVVTSAAIIMVAVFAVFGTLSVQQFKQLAVGLAISVLIDATVIRAVLLPSVMTLLGDRNWYLPRWLAGFTAGGGPDAEPPAAGDECALDDLAGRGIG
ncbi:MMPL family transporter [Trebonia kvetii]|uniref:MMPL family transporter n=1 Tax=Trebonia kvetii TaxID=2480626 RepID=UPI001C9E50DC|nr:MMPL family transporter [Trebonia kvetii]